MSLRPQRRDDDDKMVSEGEDLLTTTRPRRCNFTRNLISLKYCVKFTI